MPPEQELQHHDYDHENRLAVQMDRIPAELHAYPQWICWRYIDRGSGRKPDKQPVNPHNLHNAGVHWANTWSNSEHAYETYLEYVGRGIDGIGFVLTKTDPFVGVDVDDCILEDTISSPAQEILGKIQSYSEISPSGRGLRILLACSGFSENVRTQSLEVYSHSRFLTITGHHLQETPLVISTVSPEDIQVLLPEWAERGSTAVPQHRPPGSDGDTAALWQHIFVNDKYGTQHLRRFQGDTSLDRNDHSFTVIRLLNCLARWTQGDAAKMREMLLLSPLANEKWFSKRGKGDWLEHQIRDAISYLKKGK